MHRETPRLLLIEDDDALADLMQEYLCPHLFEFSRVASGDAGVDVDDQPDRDLGLCCRG